ncbi:inorganic diphosphatase [Candidatus Formimonas warabiya]|uniref:Inorganic pyrophosphatase n=1 Tax=Formimonas warabiya TaxID=1761012 RepID=A0A3G1KLU9_FORW1|nr:inorganic diphosphatase [Candidatus Formimonas warabiya]ATW23446.1 inorganic diphosphatase [Candidatus Formimonas warabiya]
MEGTVKAFIEIPKGSNNKYEYDKEKGEFVLDRVLYSPLHYPGDYGFIPETLADDGDPVDVLVLVTNPTFPGCTMRVKPIGALLMADDKGEDIKVLCVPVADPRMSQFTDLDALPAHTLKEVEYFFSIYKDLEEKQVITRGWKDVSFAWQVIEKGKKAYPRAK